MGKPTGSVQGFQILLHSPNCSKVSFPPDPSPAKPLSQAGPPPSSLLCMWSLEHFTCPYKSVSNKSAAPCRAPKPPVGVDQEETLAVLLPAIRRDVQHSEWQSSSHARGRRTDAQRKTGERKGRGGKAKEGIERDREKEKNWGKKIRYYLTTGTCFCRVL